MVQGYYTRVICDYMHNPFHASIPINVLTSYTPEYFQLLGILAKWGPTSHRVKHPKEIKKKKIKIPT